MNLYVQVKNRDKILFVNSFSPQQRTALDTYNRMNKSAIEPLLMLDNKRPAADWLKGVKNLTVIRADFANREAVQRCIQPYADSILTATCLGDGNVPNLMKVIPFIPNSILPTESSLEWTTEKIKMRSLLRNYDPSIAPKFAVAKDDSIETIEMIEKKVGYPLVMKPSGLAASLLVSICYHRDELAAVLKQTMRKIDQVYKKKRGRGTPEILVEEFMEGDMYSIDAYVNARGVIYFAPAVYVKTGREVGFDDFFGYMRLTPTQLNSSHTLEAQETAAKGVRALCLRSTVCHIELMRTEEGWKVIELGPRIGGFRHEMYELSYGIDHSLNDLLIRLSQKPILPRKAKGYTAVLHFYAKKQGTLKSIQGLHKAQALQSIKRLTVLKQTGDRCTFARYGGDTVLEATLFNPGRPELLADIRRLEQSIEIITE